MSETTEKALTKITEKQSQYTENDKHYWIAEQLDDLIRERDEALKRAEEVENIQNQLEIANAAAKKKESEAAIASKKLTEALQEKTQLEEKLKKEKDRAKKLKDNPKIPDELKEKLKSEAEQAAKTEYEEQSRELDERIAKVEAKIRTAEAEKATAEAKAAELAKKLSMSSAEVTEFKTAFEQVQTWNGKCLNIIDRIENPETAAKLKTAMQTFLAQALETMKGE